MMNKIKKKYNITITGYGNVVKDINFTLKSNSKQSISVVIKRSKPDEPIVLISTGFIDKDLKHIFIELAKEICIWYKEEK